MPCAMNSRLSVFLKKLEAESGKKVSDVFDMFIDEEEELGGLDMSEHGQIAYAGKRERE